MDDLVKFTLRKNEKDGKENGYVLFVTFSKREFNMSDEKMGKQIIEKYGKILESTLD